MTIFCISLLIIIGILIYICIKQKNKLNLTFKEYVEEYKNKIINETRPIAEQYENWIAALVQQYKTQEREYQLWKEGIDKSIEQGNLRLQAILDKTESEIQHRQEQSDERIKAYEEKEKLKSDQRIKEYCEQQKQTELEKLTTFLAETAKTSEEAQEELSKLLITLEDYQKRQQAINEEILRRRSIEEKEDFYRIMISDSDKSDIQILQSIRSKLTNHAMLDKLIYDCYISKPTQEMIKRVLEGRAPSGIYKITRLKTGEIYIGKSTDIKSRWGQHAKTSFGCGTIAHSILHTTIAKDGIENFTWELLEEVPKDQLGAREKYWIEFYGSKEYGLNEKAGG